MKPFERSARSRTMWLMLSMLGALALAQPAQAQWGSQGVRGPMWTCTTSQFGAIVAANAMNGERCRKQHFSPFLGLFFFSVEEKNGAPSKKCFVPKQLVAPVVQINNNCQVGVAIGGSVALYSSQLNTYVAPTTWYFCAPASAAGPIIQKNNNVQKALAVGGSVLLQSDQTNVAVPASAAQPVVQINNNVQIGVAIGGDVILSSTQTNVVG